MASLSSCVCHGFLYNIEEKFEKSLEYLSNNRSSKLFAIVCLMVVKVKLKAVVTNEPSRLVSSKTFWIVYY